MTRVVVKQPGERLVERETFAAAAVRVDQLAVQARGLVAGAAALQAVATLGGATVQLALSAGADGERYLVTLRAELAGGAVEERELEVAVVDFGWALPGGGAPYLSIGDFVARFGLDEVVRMTDAAGAGRIDRELLTRALADAQAIADAHLAGRYLLPLAAVPPIVALAVADLARNRLYPRGAPDGVAEQARAATRLLERIQAGQMVLDAAAAGAAPPAEAPSAAPVLIAPGQRRYPDGLEGY